MVVDYTRRFSDKLQIDMLRAYQPERFKTPGTQANRDSTKSRALNAWWLFCVVVFAMKLLLLWLDPMPKLFMGDSGAYVQTALTGWIPADRSYFYGYLVRCSGFGWAVLLRFY